MALTAAQVYYVTKVYPERVTPEEAEKDFNDAKLSEDDAALFQAQANVFNDLAASE